MKSQILIALKIFLLLTFLTGVVYPLAVTGMSQALMSRQASGSLTSTSEGTPLGSDLIGQNFQGQDQFWGRLSQTAEKPYSPASSGASNLGTSNPGLADSAEARLEALKVEGPVPVDLVTSSGSGLDPHISPESALVQIPRVAAASGKSPQVIEALVQRLTEGRTFGILGAPRVNVLRLNIELKQLP